MRAARWSTEEQSAIDVRTPFGSRTSPLNTSNSPATLGSQWSSQPREPRELYCTNALTSWPARTSISVR